MSSGRACGKVRQGKVKLNDRRGNRGVGFSVAKPKGGLSNSGFDGQRSVFLSVGYLGFRTFIVGGFDCE